MIEKKGRKRMSDKRQKVFLELKNVSKQFPGVKALSNVSLTINKGEIHALVGENGAGKSTLMKILSGAYKRDGGDIFIEGSRAEIHGPKEAEALGISIIYQELNLIPGLTVAENIYLGRQPRKNGCIAWKRMFCDAEKLLQELGIELDVKALVRGLSIAQRQMVEIAKAVSCNAKLVIMDEPTSSLTHQETQLLFKIMENIKEKGNAVIFITHRMDEIFSICDRLSVLRDGCYIGTSDVRDISRDELITMMIGRKLTQQYPDRNSKIGEILLEVSEITDGKKVGPLSFEVHRGEVVGFYGLVGAGRTELMRLLFGADRKKGGTIKLRGEEIKIHSPKESIKRGIGFVTEDRKGEGLFLPFSCAFNISLVSLRKIRKYGILNLKKEKEAAERYIKELNIVTPSRNQKAALLSGGNQQKIVVSKWLFSDLDLMILDEPTRGIDVGAKREIYEIINVLAEEGKAVIVVSSEMEEIMGISDRIYVMRDGALSGEVKKEEFSQERISDFCLRR